MIGRRIALAVAALAILAMVFTWMHQRDGDNAAAPTATADPFTDSDSGPVAASGESISATRSDAPALDAAPVASTRLHGVLVDDRDQPIAGAPIEARVRSAPAPRMPIEVQVVARTTSGVDGAFALDVPRASRWTELMCTRGAVGAKLNTPFGAAVPFLLQRLVELGTVRVATTCELRVAVRDPSGRAVAGIRLGALNRTGLRAADAESDADGLARLFVASDDQWSVMLADPQSLEIVDHDSLDVRIVGGTDSLDVTLVVAPAVRATLSVTDTSGAPVANAVVIRTRPDKDGRDAPIDVDDPLVRSITDTDGVAVIVRSVVDDQGGFVVYADSWRGAATAWVDGAPRSSLVIPAIRTLHLTCVDPDGATLRPDRVTVTATGRPIEWAPTEGDAVEIPLRVDQEFKLLMRKAGWLEQSLTVACPTAPAPLQARAVLQRGVRIRGGVRDARTRAPIADCPIALGWLQQGEDETRPAAELEGMGPRVEVTARTGADGGFEVVVPRIGRWLAVATAPDRARATGSVTAAVGSTTVEMPPIEVGDAGTVEVTVLGFDRVTPTAGVDVWIDREGDPTGWHGQSDAGGRCIAVAIPAGPLHVAIGPEEPPPWDAKSREQWSRAGRSCTLAPGAVLNLSIALADTGYSGLRGRVLRDHEPWPDVTLTAYPRGYGIYRTDRDGAFDFGIVSAGRSDLYVNLRRSSLPIAVDLIPGRVTEIVRDVHLTTCRGVVLTPDRKPVPDCSVALDSYRGCVTVNADAIAPDEIRGPRQGVAETTTDASGAFSFEDVEEGSYHLAVSNKGDAAVRKGWALTSHAPAGPGSSSSSGAAGSNSVCSAARRRGMNG